MQKHFFANKLISTAADSFITDAPYGENCVLKLHGERNKGRRGKGKEGGRNKDTGRWPNKMQTWPILSRSEGGGTFPTPSYLLPNDDGGRRNSLLAQLLRRLFDDPLEAG